MAKDQPNAKPGMISVEEAQKRLLALVEPLGAEQVALAQGLGRVLAEEVTARRTQPPFPVSAMDGYAARSADLKTVPARLKVVGNVPAGQSYDKKLGAGEAVRIFTGSPVPEGADCIVIQEDTTREGDWVTVKEAGKPGRHIRPAGLDFRAGDVGLKPGKRLNARDLGLAAAMNRPWLMVARRPRVAILPTGDEVVMPGDPIGPNQIVSSNGIALGGLCRKPGGRGGAIADRARRQRGLAADRRGRARLRSAAHHRRRFGRRARSDPLGAGRFRPEPRFLDGRHAPGQAVDGGNATATRR